MRLVWHQLRFDLKTFLRNPAAVFFTAVLPLIFLVVFVSVFGNDHLEGSDIKFSTYYVPNILALAVISSTFVSLAISLTTLREDAVLKRLRGTPLPARTFLISRVLVGLVVSLGLVVVLCALGRVAFGVRLPTETLPAFLVTLLVGAAAFTALGLAYQSFIPSEESAPPMTNAVVLPLYFISGVFFEVNKAFLTRVADFFPIRHFAQALFHSFTTQTGSGFSGRDLAVMAAWGVVGLLVAVRTFRWTPRDE